MVSVAGNRSLLLPHRAHRLIQLQVPHRELPAAVLRQVAATVLMLVLMLMLVLVLERVAVRAPRRAERRR